MNWYDRAVDEIEESYSSGEISKNEYLAQMRDLREELRESAREAAEQAYDDYMGCW